MRNKKAKFKELQEDDRLNTTLIQRKKSANERELERYIEEERQKKITNDVVRFRKQRQQESMKTTVLGGKNIFKGHNNILSDNKKMSIMNTAKQSGGMFFK